MTVRSNVHTPPGPLVDGYASNRAVTPDESVGEPLTDACFSCVFVEDLPEEEAPAPVAVEDKKSGRRKLKKEPNG